MESKEYIDEKVRLRKSINKSCRINTFLFVITGLFFLFNGIVHVDDVSESKLYLCPLIALMLISTLAMAFYAMIYDRIRRCPTGKEMQKYLDLLGADSKFSKLIVITMSLCLIFAAILGLVDKSPWYVIVLAVIGIAAVIYALWWLLKYSGQSETRNSDIEKLQALEEEDR